MEGTCLSDHVKAMRTQAWMLEHESQQIPLGHMICDSDYESGDESVQLNTSMIVEDAAATAAADLEVAAATEAAAAATATAKPTRKRKASSEIPTSQPPSKLAKFRLVKRPVDLFRHGDISHVDDYDNEGVDATPEDNRLIVKLAPLKGKSEVLAADGGMHGRVCYIQEGGTQSTSTPSGRRHGTTFLYPESAKQSFTGHSDVVTKESPKLFFKVGSGVYLDKPHTTSFYGYQTEDNNLRIGLWNVNPISKFQKSGSRNSITFDFDAIHQIKQALPDIENALKNCDTDSFLGFALNLDKHWYICVDKNQCSLSIRQWYILKTDQEDPRADLHPGRQGIQLNWDQFRRFRVFLEKHLEEHYPAFKNHTFKCDQLHHIPTECGLCTPVGRLPLQKYVENLMSGGHYLYMCICYYYVITIYVNVSNILYMFEGYNNDNTTTSVYAECECCICMCVVVISWNFFSF